MGSAIRVRSGNAHVDAHGSNLLDEKLETVGHNDADHIRRRDPPLLAETTLLGVVTRDSSTRATQCHPIGVTLVQQTFERRPQS